MAHDTVSELSPLDATLILFAGVARSSQFNGLARPASLYGFCHRGLNAWWLPEELHPQATAFVSTSSDIFNLLEQLREKGLLNNLGSGYAMTPVGASAIADLMRERNYTLDDLTRHAGK